MYQTERVLCANFIYDLNGKKGPNKVGKDIGFITALQSVDSQVVAPMPIKKTYTTTNAYSDAQLLCRRVKSNSRLPNIYEWMALYFNRQLTYGDSKDVSWSNTPASSNSVWIMNYGFGQITSKNKAYRAYTRCISK